MSRALEEERLRLNARIKLLEAVLAPLVNIANEYDNEGLDEARPHWVKVGVSKFDLDVELYSGRGGKQLLTLGDALRARSALTGKPIVEPDNQDAEKARKIFESLYIGGITWEGLSENRRCEYIEKFKALKL